VVLIVVVLKWVIVLYSVFLMLLFVVVIVKYELFGEYEML